MKYPKGERVWASYHNSAGNLVYIITSKTTRDYYFLYEFIEDKFKKIGKSKNPLELEEKFDIREKLKLIS